MTSTGVQVRTAERRLSDEALLHLAGSNGWLFLSKDRAITRRPDELATLRAARVAAFFLAAGDMRKPEITRAVLAALPRIRRLLKKHRPPLARRITPSGALVKLD